MALILARNWWALLLRGIAGVLFGVLAFVWPGLTLAVLVFMFGAYALVDGVFAVVAAVNAPRGFERWWVLLLEGIVGIIVGVLTFFWPMMTAFALLYFIAAWAVITGVLEIVAAIRLRRAVSGEWLLVVGGVLSILFGLALMIAPAAGALAVVWLIGIYAFVFGLLLIILSLRLRRWASVSAGKSAE
jgi:uncharacterized membrane protein HdeD (DUF308 family)